MCVCSLSRYDRQHPLALVAFSNSSRTLDSLAGAVASALFGEKPASRQSVQVLDFAQLIPSQLLASTNHDVKQVLRAALASSLGACPERTLFIMENVQVLDGATLPVLDTFLDPLNGKRAHFQQHQSGGSSKLLDSTQSVFLFLYKVERAAFEQTAMKMLSPSHGSEGDAASRKLSQHKAWRDFLMAKWMRKEGFTVEFTPQAFVGRLTEGVTLFASDDQDDAAVSDSSSDNSQQQQASRTWEQQCLAYRRSGSDDANETSDGELFFLQSHDDVLRVALGLIPAFMLLYCAKLWTQETAVKRAKRGSIKKNTKKAKRTGKKAKKKY